MKKSFLTSLIGVITLIILVAVSCNRKDVSNFNTVDNSTKELVLSYLNQQKILDPKASIFIDTLVSKSDWGHITQSSVSDDVKLIYVPLSYNRNRTGITFMYNNITQEIYYSLITEIPRNNTNIDNKTNNTLIRPIDVITSFYKNKMNGYNGSIRTYSLSNNFLWEFGYENGKRKFEKWVKKSTSNQTANNPFPIKSSSVGTNSNTSIVCSDYYFITWYEFGKITSEYIGTTCVTEGCPATLGLRQDSLSINQGTLKINSTCGGIPEDGSPGGGGAAPEYVEITNNIKDPCLKALVTLLQNPDRLDNAIAKILLNVFGTNDKINLTFTEKNDLVNKWGIPINGHSKEYKPGSYEVFLNSSELNQYSKERQTLTIMHEILHNYFWASYNNINGLQKNNHHTNMLENYIEIMASSLEDLFPNLKSNHDVTLALCFDDLYGSVDLPEPNKTIDRSVFNSVINSNKYSKFGLNLSNWQGIADKAKWQSERLSPLGTACSN
jgi:hypothetical protein